MNSDDFIVKDNIDQFGKLPKNILSLKKLLNDVEKKIKEERRNFFEETFRNKTEKSRI